MKHLWITFIFLILPHFVAAQETGARWQEPVLSRKSLFPPRYFESLRQQASLEGRPLTADEEMNIALAEAKQKLSGLSLSDEDVAQVANAWVEDRAFLWSGSSFQKDPEKLLKLLKTAFRPEVETFTIDSLAWVAPVHMKAIEDGVRVHSLHLMRTKLTEYERTKMIRAGFEKDVHTFSETSGFIVLEETATKRICSLPVVGQSFDGRHILIVGIKPDAQGNFISTFDREGSVYRSPLIFQMNGEETWLVKASPLSEICQWKESVAPTSATPLKSYSFNYSVFKFLGARLTDPLGSGLASYMFLQTPSIRRGSESACSQLEDKTWILFGTDEQKTYGGRYFVEKVQVSPQPEVTIYPHSGVDASWKFDQPSGDFTLYLWSRPDNKKTLRLTPGFSGKADFTEWLSQQIPIDPY